MSASPLDREVPTGGLWCLEPPLFDRIPPRAGWSEARRGKRVRASGVLHLPSRLCRALTVVARLLCSQPQSSHATGRTASHISTRIRLDPPPADRPTEPLCASAKRLLDAPPRPAPARFAAGRPHSDFSSSPHPVARCRRTRRCCPRPCTTGMEQPCTDTDTRRVETGSSDS